MSDTGRITGKEKCLWVVFLFLLLMVRACAAGLSYWPILDDYIQYHNYLNSESISALHTAVGLLASRPLAGLADYFVWGRMYDFMLLGVAAISLLYAASAVLLRDVLGRYFRVGPVFLVAMALPPLGVEGTYWMSASTRIVVGLFFAVLSARLFLKWLDRPRFGVLVLYLLCQLLPFGFYEQAGIFSITLTVGLALLEVLYRRGNRWEWLSLWSVAAMGINLAAAAMLSRGGVYASRAELVLPTNSYYWKTFFPEILSQIKTVFLDGGFYTLAKGFVRGCRLISSGQLIPWAGLVTLLCAGMWIFLRRRNLNTERKKFPWLALLVGILLAVAPVTIFFVLGNPWFSFRGAVMSFPGLALIADALVEWLWCRLSSRRDGPLALAAVLALVFCVAGASEMQDWRDTYENDQRAAGVILKTLQQDIADADPSVRVGILGMEASFLPNQNYFWHEHVCGCTESSWALNGVLASMQESPNLPSVTPLPSTPMYRNWNAQTNRPSRFDFLYYYDGSELIPVTLKETGDGDYFVCRSTGEILGRIWEEPDGLGYFRLSEESLTYGGEK